MKKAFFVTGLITFFFNAATCQNINDTTATHSLKLKNQQFINSNFHDVFPVAQYENPEMDTVKNIILMIGDGMGSSHVSAGSYANKGDLNMLNLPITGFSLTSSSDDDITDSAAGATAMASGVKTYNGAIGVDSTGLSVETILEKAEKAGLATGLVATCRITHATPASFVAHKKNRIMYEGIAADFLNIDIDVFIGGGRNNFTKRRDQQNLIDSLIKRNYSVVTSTDSLNLIESGKLAGLIHADDQEKYSQGRGEMLEKATRVSLKLLSQDPEGFFLMIEGSQIDWGGHDNDTGYLVEELLDFDRSVGIVLDFAQKNPGTLVIITADHETGGFSVINSDQRIGKIEGSFTTGNHTGVMVPVFAYGPQATKFAGTYENTEIFYKMKSALNLK